MTQSPQPGEILSGESEMLGSLPATPSVPTVQADEAGVAMLLKALGDIQFMQKDDPGHSYGYYFELAIATARKAICAYAETATTAPEPGTVGVEAEGRNEPSNHDRSELGVLEPALVEFEASVKSPKPDVAGAREFPQDSYRDIARELSSTVEGLIYGLPDLLKSGDLKDEEGLIDKAAHVLDTTAFRMAQLDLEAADEIQRQGEEIERLRVEREKDGEALCRAAAMLDGIPLDGAKIREWTAFVTERARARQGGPDHG